MQRFIVFTFLSACFAFTSCNSSSSSGAAEKPVAENTAAPPTSYPSIPSEKIVNLFETCDFIDYILYDYEFSLSQGEKPAIQASFSHISKTVPTINPNCQPIGRIFYQVEGQNALEADIYFNDGCKYYIFLENNQPKYANELTPAGIGFYEDVFKRFAPYRKK